MNFHTPKLLAERGFRWDSSLMDSDHPRYVLAVEDGWPHPGRLVEVPVSWGLDDWEQYAAFFPCSGLTRLGGHREPREGAMEMCGRSNWTRCTGSAPRSSCAATRMSCRRVGPRSRAEALDRLIERMKVGFDGLWITTVGEVARHTASLSLAPRTCPQPVIPADAYWVARPPTPEGT